MENRDLIIGLVGGFMTIILALGVPYGTYKYGRMAERRALTRALSDSLEETCSECYVEGGKAGYKQGKVDGLKHCDYLIDEDNDGDHR